MKEQEQKPKPEPEKKQETKKAAANKQTAAEKEKIGVWANAAKTIAGDNKLMQGVFQILLSPITLLIGLGLIIYLFIKVNTLNKEVSLLKQEKEKMLDEKENLEDDYEKLRKRYKKLKRLYEPENKQTGALGFIPQTPSNKKTYKTNYLD